MKISAKSNVSISEIPVSYDMCFYFFFSYYYILLYFYFSQLMLMNTSCKIKRKNRRRVEKENSKMNTDSSEDSISLINNDTHIIIYVITLRDKASIVTFSPR